MKTPETVFAKKFEKAFLAGERSDVSIHKALIEGLVEFVKTDYNTTGIAWAVRYMQSRNAESHRFHAILKYLRDVARLRVIINEDDISKTNVKTRKGYEYGNEWLQECKSNPWYKVARSMQKAKPWVDPLESMIRKYAEGFIMGDITEDQLREDFAPKVVSAILALKTDEKLQKKATLRLIKLDEQGDLIKKAA